MIPPVKDAKARAAMAKLALTMLREMSAAYNGVERFGSNSVEMLLSAAVFVGHAEGRPMNASKLADFSGIPRPTVIRKLREMVERGSVQECRGEGYVISPELVNSQAVLSAVEIVRREILRTADIVSSSNSEAVARQDRGTITRDASDAG